MTAERAQTATKEPRRAVGRVQRLLPDKGFGFIRGEDGLDYFFHASELANCGIAQLRADQAVTFVPGTGPKGPRASDVVAVF